MVKLVSHNKFKERKLLMLIWKFKSVMAKIEVTFLIFQDSTAPVMCSSQGREERKGQKENQTTPPPRMQEVLKNSSDFCLYFIRQNYGRFSPIATRRMR